jgi:hypothetical protein
MTTHIVSNGNKWAGQSPDGILELLDALQKYTLDRRFEALGCFYTPVAKLCDQQGNHSHLTEYEGLAHFFGNFFDYSHVFSVYTDDPELIRTLLDAIEINRQKHEYLAQDKPEETTHPYRKDCRCMECRYAQAALTCPVCSHLS